MNKNINYVGIEEYSIIYEHLRIFGNILGYIFQISDDLLDYEDDIKNNKPNICSIIEESLVLIILNNGCNWLYINSIYIKQLMEEIDTKNDIINNNNNKSTEYSSIDKNNTIKITKLSFDIKPIHEIIEKIENRIKTKLN